MNFAVYTPMGKAGWESITLERLCELAQRELIVARAEDSGCEGCYIEVARWNQTAQRWERFAFEKVFGGELDGPDGETCYDAAHRIAEMVQPQSTMSFIHSLPTYDEVLVEAAS